MFEANRKRRRDLVEMRWKRVRRISITDRDASEATTPTATDPDGDEPLQLNYHGSLLSIPTSCVNPHAKLKWVGKDGTRVRKQARALPCACASRRTGVPEKLRMEPG